MSDYDDERGFDPDDVPDDPFADGVVEGVVGAPKVTISVPAAGIEPAAQPDAEPDGEDEYETIYYDAHGNEITEAEAVALGATIPGADDVMASEPSRNAAPAAMSGKGKAILAGVGVAVVAVVGVVAVGLSNLGGQNTVEQAKAAGQSQYARASESVAAKSSAVRESVSASAIDTCSGGLAAAMASGSQAPRLRLDVISAVPLPGAFIAATTPNADGVSGKVSLLQLSKTGWGVYVTTPLTRAERKQEVTRPGFWKADVTVDGDKITVTGDRVWAGGDTGGAGSCEPGEPGVYAASGKVPADAAGLVDGQAEVTAIQGVAGDGAKAVAVMGNSVVLVRLVEAPAEGGEASSSSAVPSK